MITLITGLPGNGKTLYALTWLKREAEKDGRTVMYSGITDCMIPGWIEHDPEKWYELPPKSVILIDEVQRVMRPRMHGSVVPKHIAELETHRHKGVDLVLITQHPMLLDSNVRRLVGQHFHVVRKFGSHFATIHEWNAVKDNCDKNRDDSIRHEWRFPKETFALYKSAEVHTHKRRVPARVWAFLALPFMLAGLAYYTYGRIMDKTKPPAAVAAVSSASAPVGSVGGSGIAPKMTRAAYIEQYAPRIAGLAFTAPVYDDLTKPVVAPYPAACVVRHATTLLPSGLSGSEVRPSECRCYTQQGTRLEVPDGLCRELSEKGFFVPWAQQPQQPQQQPQQKAVVPQTAEPWVPPQAAGIYASGRRESPSASILPSSDPSTLPPGRGRAPPSRPQGE